MKRLKIPAVLRTILAMAAASLIAVEQSVPARCDPNVLRAVMNGDLRSLDPLWTIAPQTRIHAYMVYDTLLGTDEQSKPQPQMADRWTESFDHLTYTFTLRDNLRFSDGAPVTPADVIASFRRWMLVDSGGQYVAEVLASAEQTGSNSFMLRLKEPFPQLIRAISKPSAVPMFVMPARLIDGLPASKQLTDP